MRRNMQYLPSFFYFNLLFSSPHSFHCLLAPVSFLLLVFMLYMRIYIYATIESMDEGKCVVICPSEFG